LTEYLNSALTLSLLCNVIYIYFSFNINTCNLWPDLAQWNQLLSMTVFLVNATDLKMVHVLK
jgi:hypothetical protein